jgi:hypothetical protein
MCARTGLVGRPFSGLATWSPHAAIAVETLRSILDAIKRHLPGHAILEAQVQTRCSQEKATRIMGAYRTCPADGVVVCFEEFGPRFRSEPYPGGVRGHPPGGAVAPRSAGAGWSRCS